MKKMLLILLTLLLVFGSSVFAQHKAKSDIRTKSTEQLIQDFISDNWGERVAPAEAELESRQTAIISDVVRLLDNEEKVKLRNTWDLIYPGAEKFYGHGWVLDYDVDSISVRAGWLLEELTFQDFGFRQGVIDHDEILMTVIKGKSELYINDLKAKLKGQDANKQARILAAQKAKDWIQKAGKTWNRFDAILLGLRGNNVALQYRIFQWLRNGDTKCDGLTLASFAKFVLPEVKRLAKSSDENIQKETGYLLEDDSKGKWWFRNKLKRDFPDTYASMELR